MKYPSPDETAIEGRWIFSKGKMVADEAALRIDDLTTCYLEFVREFKRGQVLMFKRIQKGSGFNV
jgi:hypothetical protein